ncbi:MAG: hypothetical protein PHT71_04655, partial [Victivallaceae bacterium]|nr:hypothetical protein [Victivallaceae bacterium]
DVVFIFNPLINNGLTALLPANPSGKNRISKISPFRKISLPAVICSIKKLVQYPEKDSFSTP